MIALIKKDLRVFEVPIVGGVALLLLTYLLVNSWMLSTPYSLTRSFAGVTTIAAIAGSWMTVVMAAVFGGAAFSNERRERSADFLAMLPVARTRVILSKAITGIACLLAFWIINGGLMLLANLSDPGIVMGTAGPLGWARLPFAAAIMTFGLGWLLGTFLNSPSLATTISIAASLSTLIFIFIAVVRDDVPASIAELRFLLTAQTICAVVGIACFVIGTIYYVRRVEP